MNDNTIIVLMDQIIKKERGYKNAKNKRKTFIEPKGIKEMA